VISSSYTRRIFEWVKLMSHYRNGVRMKMGPA
jgi:hypothetical protein